MSDSPYRYQGSDSILLDWEAGRWAGAPPPPAVHSEEYRQLIINIFLGLSKSYLRPSLLSLGCGNATIEVELHKLGFEVLATDYAETAIALAARKNLLSKRLDVLESPNPTQRYDFIYADGLLGHVAIRPKGIAQLARTMSSYASDGGTIILANELSDYDSANYAVTGYAKAQFFRPGPGEVSRLLTPLLPGWALQTTRLVTYIRPERGMRRREILVFRQV